MTRWPRTIATSAASVGQLEVANRAPGARRTVGQGDLDQVRLALAEGEEPHDVADLDRLLDERGEHPRGRDGDVHAPCLGEQPLVGRVVDAGDDSPHRELGLGQQRHHEVDLVVAGRADDDVVLLELGVLEVRHLAGIGEQPLGVRDAIAATLGGSLSISRTA